MLILINKQDLTEENPITVQEAVEQYDISNLVGRSFNIIPSSAKYGYGIEDAMSWLINKIEEVKARK